MIQDEQRAWDKEWRKRIKGESIHGNVKKFRRIVDFIWNNPQYFHLDKLDIGCGPAHHAASVAQFVPLFSKTWTGIDLSSSAIEQVWAFGLNGIRGNFLEYGFDKKFDIFYFWDSLEHFEDLNEVAKKVLRLRKKHIIIAGNIPLFYSKQEGGAIEKPMDINKLRVFLKKCGCTQEWIKVYGTDGWPFLMFEAEGSLNE